MISCCFLLLAVPLAGASKIIRRLVWSEQAFFFSDFLAGLKESFVKILILTVIISAAIYGLYSLQMVANLNWFLKYVPYGVFVVILLPFFLHFIVLINVYNQPIGQAVRNSFIMYFKTPFLTILFAALPLVSVYLISLINLIAVRILIHALIIVALLPVYLLLWFLYDIHALDKNVNKTLFPEAYRRGLYIAKDENEEAEE